MKADEHEGEGFSQAGADPRRERIRVPSCSFAVHFWRRLLWRGTESFGYQTAMTSAAWAGRGKTVAGLIRELQSFEDQTLEVRISIDAGATSLPISLVGKLGNRYAVLMNVEDSPAPLEHDPDRRPGATGGG